MRALRSCHPRQELSNLRTTQEKTTRTKETKTRMIPGERLEIDDIAGQQKELEEVEEGGGGRTGQE